jgi:hypothetical protein
MGNRARDPSACSIVPQPTTLPYAPKIIVHDVFNFVVKFEDVMQILKTKYLRWSSSAKAANT